MTKDLLGYDRLVDQALRGVVRDVLRQVAEAGLPGAHHFYITFLTGYPGVQIPEYLQAQYPNEITIVLQFQFFGLDVEEDQFSVTLSFNNIQERLVIPFEAISSFVDPSVKFGHSFQTPDTVLEPAEPIPALTTDDHENKRPADTERRGEVVALDAFRKK